MSLSWENLLAVELLLSRCYTAAPTDLMLQHLTRVSPFVCSLIGESLGEDEFLQLVPPVASSDPNERHYWMRLVASFLLCINTLPLYLRLMVYRAGIPTHALRARIWGVLTGACDAHGVVNDVTYTKLYALMYGNGNLFERLPQYKQIVLDVHRTFPAVPFFKRADTQRQLLRILNAYLLYDIEVGYCQGLAFVVGCLLYGYSTEQEVECWEQADAEMDFPATPQSLDEQALVTLDVVLVGARSTASCDSDDPHAAVLEMVFVLLCKTMEINHLLRTIFDPTMSGIVHWFDSFTQLVSQLLPDVSAHFVSLDVDYRVFLSQWFLLCFGISCPFPVLLRIIDLSVLEGFHPTMFRTGMVLLKANRDVLLACENEELVYRLLLSLDAWQRLSSATLMHMMEDLPLDAFLPLLLEKKEENWLVPGHRQLSHKLSSNSLLPPRLPARTRDESAWLNPLPTFRLPKMKIW